MGVRMANLGALNETTVTQMRGAANALLNFNHVWRTTLSVGMNTFVYLFLFHF
jgi:hypothetical protein